jgi:predicted dehydrogenase
MLESINKILICGLGSIGLRHARIFKSLGVKEVLAYSTGKSTLKLDNNIKINKKFNNLDTALKEDPDLVIISNPTSLHLETLSSIIPFSKHTLIEKPLCDTASYWNSKTKEVKKKKAMKIAVGYHMRFHPLIIDVKKVIETHKLGRPIRARGAWYTWCPDWHPWEDYKGSYVCRRDLGGGAMLTLSHEINYLQWLFGEFKHVRADSSRFAFLDTGVDEASTLTIRHESNVISELSLDLFSYKTRRDLEIFFTNGYIKIDFLKNILKIKDVKEKETEVKRIDGFDIDKTYLEQAKQMDKYITTGEKGNLCTYDESILDLKLISTAQKF